jgi:outer membrane protein assembly factor BamA
MTRRTRTHPMRLAWALLLSACVAFAGIKIKVEGNAALKGYAVKEVIAPEPEDYSKRALETWQEDAQFYAADLYRKQGYFDAKVDVELKPKPGGGPKDWLATLTIQEGDRYVFDTVRVVVVQDTSPARAAASGKDTSAVGIDTAKVDTIKLAPPQQAPLPALVMDTTDLKAKKGKPYREDWIFVDRREILQGYGNSGFVRAKVDDKVTVKEDSKSVRVDYLVEPSYPVLFDTLLLDNRRAPPADSLYGITRDKLLRSFVKYGKGDTVRLKEEDRLIEKLEYTGAYNYVRLSDSLLPGSQHRSALRLQMEERMPGTLKSSIFYDTYSGFGISGDARHSNFMGTLNEVRGGAALATLRQTVYAGYGSPITFGYMIRFDGDISTNWYQDQPIHYPGTDSSEGYFLGDFQAINSMRLTWPFKYWLNLTGNSELEVKSRMLGATSRERSLNLNFIGTTAFSFLNQALDPTRGIRFAPSVGNGGALIEEGGLALLGARHNWLQMQSGYYYYHPAFKPLKAAVRLDGGRFFGRGGTNSDRFFLGGGRSVRSYPFHGLCPEVETDSASGTPVCSTQEQTLAYLLASYEVRFAPFGFRGINPNGGLKLELVPFYDFGKVWDMEGGFALSGSGKQGHGQGVAMGMGLRYPILGLFNFRLDLAYGRPGGGTLPDAWIIDLAQAF